MINKKICFVGVFVLVFGIISLMSVSAALTAPTALDFSGNDTASYDNDGTVFLNWTGTASENKTYRIFIYSDDELYTTGVNDSALGFTFTNTTDANYTFTVQAENATASQEGNSTNISMIIDTTVPEISYNSVGTPSNATGADRDWIFVNVTSTDTNNVSSKVVFNLYYSNATLVNSTQYDYVSSGIQVINWTSLPNAAYIFNVTANDSATNSNSTASKTFYLDGGSPSATPSCSPSTIYTNDPFPCTCTGSDSISSVSTSASSNSGSTSDTSVIGTYTYTCTATDLVGNSKSSTATYTVLKSGGSGSSETTWTTYSIDDATFEKGYVIQIGANKRVKINVGGEDHHVSVISVSSEEVTLEIASDPVEVSLSPGEDVKLDLDDDGFYDTSVVLNKIVVGKADLTIKKINEQIPEGEKGSVSTTGDVEGSSGDEKKNSSWVWILVVVGILVVAWFLMNPKKKRK